jgi:hypothetical protein
MAAKKLAFHRAQEQQTGEQAQGTSFVAEAIAEPPIAQRVVDDHMKALGGRHAQSLKLNSKCLCPNGLWQALTAKRQPAFLVDVIR